MGKNVKKAMKAKGSALVKGRAVQRKPAGILKVSLKARNLAKLGKLKLSEKVEAVGKEATAEEAAALLKGAMTKKEHSAAWSRHQTFLNQNPEEKEKYDALSKTEKGNATAMFLVKKEHPKFLTVQESFSANNSLVKREVWKSEQQMLQAFSEQEFLLHLESGRIQYRQDPWTANVWNYRDLGDVKKHSTVNSKKEWSLAQEYKPQEDDESEFQKWKSKDLALLLQDVQEGKGKGKGGGGGKALGKGDWGKKGKGSAKGQQALQEKEDNQLALQDGKVEEEETEESWHKALGKAKKARDQMSREGSDLEAAIKMATASKRLTKVAKKEAEATLADCYKYHEALKVVLVKKEKGLSFKGLKELLTEAAAAAKAAKDEAKELNQLARKTASKASSKK